MAVVWWVFKTGWKIRKGRVEVERVHAAMHTTQFHHGVCENHEVQVQLLGPDLGLAHFRWSIHGDFDPDGTPGATRSGRFYWLLQRDGQRWLIRAAQNTNIVALQGASARPVMGNGASKRSVAGGWP